MAGKIRNFLLEHVNQGKRWSCITQIVKYPFKKSTKVKGKIFFFNFVRVFLFKN